mgnify:FL=1
MRFVIDARYAAEPSGIGTYVRAICQRMAAISGRSAELRFWVAPAAPELSSAPNVRHHLVRSKKASLATLLWPSHLGCSGRTVASGTARLADDNKRW